MKTSVDVEMQKSKRKASSQVVTASVLNESLTPCLECARNYMKFVCEGLSAHSLWRSDLAKGLVSFIHSVLFLLPQKTSCFLLWLLV